MGNTITALLPKILAAGVKTLRESCLMTQLVNKEYSLSAKIKGSTIDVPIPTAVATYAIVPSATAKTPGNAVPTTVPVTLDNWQGGNFHLTDQEETRINADDNFIPMQAAETVRSLARDVNTSLLNLYKGIPGIVGTAGTTPFSNSTDRTAAKDATMVAALLNAQLCPRTDRYAVIDTNAEAEALALPQFSHAEKAGSNNVIETAAIGNKYGIGWFTENDIQTHTAGSAASGATQATATVKANAAKGASVVSIGVHADDVTAGRVGLLVGDVISFAGHTQTYTVTDDVDLDANGENVSIYPPLKVAVSSTAVVTLTGSHTVNLAFNKYAFALATAPLKQGENMMSVLDPVTGLVLRLEKVRQNKQDMWEFDILWGGALIRPEFACRLLG